jgi:DNA-binding MarR family transcriptional regulator
MLRRACQLLRKGRFVRIAWRIAPTFVYFSERPGRRSRAVQHTFESACARTLNSWRPRTNSGVKPYSQNLTIRQNRDPPHPAPTARDDLNKATQKPRQRPARSDGKSCPWSNIARSGSNLNIDEFLTFRLTRLANALRTNLTKRYLEEFDLSIPEWRLLALVTRFSPVRFSELTSRSSMDKGQVSRTLQVMTKRGLIKMKVVKQRGSRSAAALAAPVIVSVAPKGKAMYRQVLPVARQRQAEILRQLSETERLSLYGVLDRLFALVGSVAVEPSEEASEEN